MFAVRPYGCTKSLLDVGRLLRFTGGRGRRISAGLQDTCGLAGHTRPLQPRLVHKHLFLKSTGGREARVSGTRTSRLATPSRRCRAGCSTPCCPQNLGSAWDGGSGDACHLAGAPGSHLSPALFTGASTDAACSESR